MSEGFRILPDFMLARFGHRIRCYMDARRGTIVVMSIGSGRWFEIGSERLDCERSRMIENIVWVAEYAQALLFSVPKPPALPARAPGTVRIRLAEANKRTREKRSPPM